MPSPSPRMKFLSILPKSSLKTDIELALRCAISKENKRVCLKYFVNDCRNEIAGKN